MNSFYNSPFDDSGQNGIRINRKLYAVLFIVIGVAITFWGGMVSREMRDKSREIITEHSVTLGAWIGYTGDGEFAQGKDLTLQRVRLYYMSEQERQTEYYEYDRDGDTCRLCSYTIGRFDEQGNCVYQVSESEDGEGMVQEYFLYQYDSDNRVIQQASYREGGLVQVADFSYPDEGVTAVVVHGYQDGVFLPESSYGLVRDQTGQELLRVSLDMHEAVSEEESEEPEVYRWYSSDRGGRIQYLLEVPETGADAYLARYEYEYEYNTAKTLNAEYLYRWQPDPENDSLNLQDDTITLFDGVEFQRLWQEN